MATPKTAVVVMAAGLGTRMRSARPKVMAPLGGRPMIAHVMAAVAAVRPDLVALVVGPDMGEAVEAARAAAPGVALRPVLQRERRGTGHAVRLAARALAGFAGDVLVANGDGPLVRGETYRALLAALRRRPAADLALLGARQSDPGQLGRIVVDAAGGVDRIVEARDATPEERKIDLCYSGVLAASARTLFDLVKRIKPDNAKGEYYLTDAVGLARARGLALRAVEGDPDEPIGINTRAELAAAEDVLQRRLRSAAMEAGVTLVDPASVWLSHDTVFGRDVTVQPHVVFGPGVEIGDDVLIRSFCHLEGVRVARGAQIGPFARLRPGAEIGAGAHVGNFVEIKAARVEEGAKVNHLTYIGDARVGARANVGAGTITCNYDGFVKSFTDIGEGAFIGSNSALVAPVKIGPGAIVAAGSVITRDVPGDALALARGRQDHKPGWAQEFRSRRAADRRKA